MEQEGQDQKISLRALCMLKRRPRGLDLVKGDLDLDLDLERSPLGDLDLDCHGPARRGRRWE